MFPWERRKYLQIGIFGFIYMFQWGSYENIYTTILCPACGTVENKRIKLSCACCKGEGYIKKYKK
jgi:hypothetical protein